MIRISASLLEVGERVFISLQLNQHAELFEVPADAGTRNRHLKGTRHVCGDVVNALKNCGCKVRACAVDLIRSDLDSSSAASESFDVEPT